MSRLGHIDRPTGVPLRYERDRPGELLHVDVKKIGRIPAGGGWRMLGRGTEARRRSEAARRKGRLGYDYLHAAVDDHSRVAYVEVHADERGETCAQFLASAAAFYAEHGVRIEAVMTDNAMNYVRSAAFTEALARLGAHHQRIPAYRPQANGKVERFNRTMAEEWAYIRPYCRESDRTRALARWLHRYNHHRVHTAIGDAPITRVTNLPREHS